MQPLNVAGLAGYSELACLADFLSFTLFAVRDVSVWPVGKLPYLPPHTSLNLSFSLANGRQQATHA